MLDQAHLCPIEKQNSDLGDGPHDHLGGVLRGVECLGNIAGIDDCLVSDREPTPSAIVVVLVDLFQVHEQSFPGSEGGDHAESLGIGEFKLWELLPVVIVVQEYRCVDLHNHKIKHIIMR